MDGELINKMIDHWGESFFTEPLLIGTFTFCLIIGCCNHCAEKERFFFLFYFFVGVMLFVIESPIESLHVLTGKRMVVFSETFNTIFELAEFIAFYHFFKECLKNNRFKKIPTVLLTSLLIIVGIFFTRLFFPTYTVDYIRKYSFFINAIEFLFLTVMCLAYFYQLFTVVPKNNLLQRPSFFITTSTFFYSILLIPFFIIAWDMRKMERSAFRILFACHFFLLTIMLLALSKAFLCKKPITT